MAFKKILPLIVLSSTLTACITPYAPSGLMGGYSEMRLREDTYFITFRGNAFTSSEVVQSYSMRRAAELTLQNGYKYFVILSGGTSAKKEVVQTPTRIETTSNGSYSGGGSINTSSFGNNTYGSYSSSGYGHSHSSTTILPGTQYSILKYKTGITVKMLHSNRKYPQAYDAKIILSNYQDQVKKRVSS